MLALLFAATTLVDLTYPFDAKTLYWPTAGGDFQLKQLHYGRTPVGFFYSAYSFCTAVFEQIVFARSQAPLRFGRSRHCDTTPEKPGIRVAQVTGRSPRRPDFEHAGRAGFSPISLFTRRAARAPPGRTRLAA